MPVARKARATHQPIAGPSKAKPPKLAEKPAVEEPAKEGTVRIKKIQLERISPTFEVEQREAKAIAKSFFSKPKMKDEPAKEDTVITVRIKKLSWRERHRHLKSNRRRSRLQENLSFQSQKRKKNLSRKTQ